MSCVAWEEFLATTAREGDLNLHCSLVCPDACTSPDWMHLRVVGDLPVFSSFLSRFFCYPPDGALPLGSPLGKTGERQGFLSKAS